MTAPEMPAPVAAPTPASDAGTSRPAAVLFDFDNTLVDTEQFWMANEVGVAADFGGTWTLDDTLHYCGKPTHEMSGAVADNIEQATGVRPDPDAVYAEIEHRVISQVVSAGDVVLPGVRELLTALRAEGIPLAVVTSSPRALLQPVLEAQLAGMFDVSIAGDEVTTNKPDPEPYAKAASELGVDPAQCLVVEDSSTGAASGNAAGCVVLAIPRGATVPDAPHRVRLNHLEGATPDTLFTLWRQGLAGTNKLGMSGVRVGPLQPGERVTLHDPKGRRHSVVLRPGMTFHTTKGGIRHEDLLGGPDAVVATSTGGMEFLVLRPIMSEFTVTMPREAAVIYPKDAAQILMCTDIFPGARVLEAGVGSGALSIALLRALGPDGRLRSYERRAEFAEVARRNVETWLGDEHPTWQLTVGDLVESLTAESSAGNPQVFDRAVLDMLAPWECVDAVGERLVPGGILTCYVATTTQMGRVMDTLRAHGGFTEPQATETTTRDWRAEGLAIRPAHSTTGHTGFLVTSRRLAPGVTAPMRKRRPAPGAYGPDYTGPRPANIPENALKHGVFTEAEHGATSTDSVVDE